MSYSKIINDKIINDDLTGQSHFFNIIVTASFNIMHLSNMYNASDSKTALLQPSPIFISIGKKDIPIQQKRI